MNADMGTMTLVVSMLIAAAAMVLALVSWRLNRPGLFTASRRLMYGFAVTVSASVVVMVAALMQNDFSLAYVASYSERALPTGFKFAALWAGQEGSLLLWAWLLAVIGMVVAIGQRKARGPEPAVTLATVAGVCTFFAAMLVFAADPFKTLPTPAADGHGLNPLLQHPSMILHPPMLFVGYAGFTVPFAMLIGALATGRADDAWIGATRRWLLVSWLFLSVGILLGAQWAYEELGWGGYWAWDPVENASLLPWLTATAVLHTVGMQRYSGVFKKTNAMLLAGTFLLCIFATYLTRSGVIQSVHAFGESLIGTFFLVFLIITTFGSIAMIVWRRKLLKSASLQKLGVKGQAFAMAVVLLVVMTIITAVGTIFPLISSVVTKPINVGPEFYNIVVGPIGMLLLAVMATGPLLRTEAGSDRHLKRGAMIPGTVAAIVVVVCLVMGITLTWALAAAAITGFAVLAVLADLIGRYRIEAGRDRSVTLLRLIDASHYRYGGQLVHMGMIMILVGVIGSSLFNQRDTFKLRAGQIGHIGRYTLKFNGLAEQREGNYTAVAAHVDVFDAGTRRSVTLHPQMRFYDKAQDSHSEVALHSTLGEDLYMTIAGWDDGGKLVALQAIVNPLVGWIWIGGITLVVGGVLSVLPRLLRQRKVVTAPGSVADNISSSPNKLAEVSR